MTTALAHKRITIVGAGPGGLTCARILQRHGIPVTVYDRDSESAARNQGGSLDLHEEDGQVALRAAGLLDDFFALARFDGQEMRGLAPSGTLVSHHLPAEDEKASPEIDRGQLRDLLLGSLEPGTVEWGRTLHAVGGPSGGPRTLTFTDGTSVETDLVIGADGASSRVRRAVSSATPVYTGVSFLEAWFDDVETRHPELAALVGRGSAHAADGVRGLFAQRSSGGHMRVYVMQRVPLGWIGAEELADTEAVRGRVLREFAGWSPLMRRLIADNDGRYVDRPILALPAPHTWEQSPSVTLLGDAAHLMPPLGVGVNLAMLDAAELARAIAGADTLAEAVRIYESTMLPRASETAIRLDGRAGALLESDDEQPVGA